MMPPKPPRTKYSLTSTITSSYEVIQAVYKDPAAMPAVTDESLSEVKVKPVPRPRSKIQPKSPCDNSNDNTVEDTTSNTTNAVTSELSEHPTDRKTSSPVHPPPRPPLRHHMTSRKLTAAVDGGNHSMTSIYEPNPPAVCTERTLSPSTLRPERPPPPSTSLKSEDTDESQQSSSDIDSMSASQVLYEEEVNLSGTYSCTKPPAVRTERTVSPSTLRPERPPPPSTSYSLCSTVKLKSEDTDESQQSSSDIDSTPASPVSPVLYEEEVKLSGIYSCTKPPAVCTERTVSPSTLRPERPPPPSTSYSPRSTVKLKSEDTDESQQSSSDIDSMPASPVSLTVCKEAVKLCGNYSCTKATDRPAVPPRLGQSSHPCSATLYDTSPKKTRPPPPSFTPPPPPSKEKTLDTLYSEIDHRPYLDVLPEDVDKMPQERPTLRYQTGTPCRKTIEDAEDMIGMLRWLKRVSKNDALPSSLYGLSIEEEIRTFNQRAVLVRKALRLYNLLMMKRNESLRNVITEFSSISDSLDKLKKKGKTMDIAGGTTGAVGGVTAVLGIAFAPMTMGTSLIATAIGAGMVASAGGMGAHTVKANKKIVNKMAVEKLVYEYRGNVVDVELCLDFILSGMNELRRHDIARLQRAGAQCDALKLAHLSQFVFRNNMNNDRRASVAHAGGMSSERLLLAFAKELDLYFTENDDQKLKKSNKSRFSGRVRLLAENLKEELEYLNHMWQMFS